LLLGFLLQFFQRTFLLFNSVFLKRAAKVQPFFNPASFFKNFLNFFLAEKGLQSYCFYPFD